MSDKPYLSHISIYPVKSLDGISLSSASILASGAIQHDRTFALLDERGNFVNGKRNPKVHRLRSHIDLKERVLTLRLQDTEQEHTFYLDTQREVLNAWLSAYFSRPITIIEDTTAGFPDDTQSPGPTVISTATLQTVASWFPGLDEQSIRLRFRIPTFYTLLLPQYK